MHVPRNTLTLSGERETEHLRSRVRLTHTPHIQLLYILNIQTWVESRNLMHCINELWFDLSHIGSIWAILKEKLICGQKVNFIFDAKCIHSIAIQARV